MKVSLVITNYEAEGVLRRCLPQVVRYAETSELVDEIILVDDGSKDGSCEFVRRECPAVKLIALPENRGFARTANAGFRAAKNPAVLLLSNDMVPADDCVENLLPHLKDVDIFAVTPQQLNEDGTTLFASHTAVVRWGEPKWLPRADKSMEAVTHFGGAVSLYNRQLFLDVSGFDEELLLPFCVEDTDLFYRAWKRGFTVVYEPRASVYHYHQNPTTIVRRVSKQRLQRIVRKNRFLYVWKNVHNGWMFAAHAGQTIVRLMFSWLVGDLGYYRSFADALQLRRTVIRKRNEERLASRRTDRQAIKAINALRVHDGENTYPRILVIRRRYLGDLILMGAVLKNVRLHMPEAWVTLVVDENYQDVYSRSRSVNEILALPIRHEESAWAYMKRWRTFVKRLRAHRFDVVYDLTENERTALVTRLCRADRRVSYLVGNKRNWKHRLYDVLVPWENQSWHSYHIRDFLLAPFEATGVPIVTRSIAMDVHPDDVTVACRILGEVFPADDRPLVMIHPGSRRAGKCWPPENFAAVCDALARQRKARVLVLGGGKDDPSVKALVAAAQTKPATLDRQLTVPQLAALLQQADVFLGNDSGPMHVAAAVGTRVVALFGAQPASFSGPVGDMHIVLRPPDCAPCPYPGVCQPPNGETMLCVRRITVDEVIGAVERQLAEVSRARRDDREVARSK